ncbi:hypothetical protein M0804_009765 [Polistes exclamans]|nr:hypothetical protein M0804_009765 [Polistes exclamans]
MTMIRESLQGAGLPACIKRLENPIANWNPFCQSQPKVGEEDEEEDEDEDEEDENEEVEEEEEDEEEDEEEEGEEEDEEEKKEDWKSSSHVRVDFSDAPTL